MLKIGFLINPIAGMGGKVGLKGTDGKYQEALKRGAEPVTPHRAREFLQHLNKEEFLLFVPDGAMGADVVKELDLSYEIVYKPAHPTSPDDTKHACAAFLKHGAELIVFVGGDGTARDVLAAAGEVPILGVPSGVKMYSSVFCIRPEKCAEILKAMSNGQANIGEGEVLDIDETAYRENKLRIKLYGFARVPQIRDLVQNSKSEYGHDDDDEKESIAEFFAETLEDDTLYILGAGTTTAKLAEKLNVQKTLLGIDAIYNKKVVGKDLNERELLDIIEKYPHVKLVVTPIGAQGFVFGRGNQQLSSKVLAKIGKDNIIIVATPTKLADLKKLRMDISNGENLKGYYKVLTGYGRYKIIKME